VDRGQPEPDALVFEPEGDDEAGWQEFAERRPRGGRRSLWLVVALVVLGALLAVLIVSGGQTDKATEPTTLPSTTEPASTSPRSSAPSSTAAAAPFRTVGLGPVIGTAVGRRLVGVTRRGPDWFLVDLDLDTGDSIQTPVPGLTAPAEFGAGLIPVAGGAVIYSQPGPAVLVTNDGVVRHVGTDYPQTIYPGPDSRSAWWVDYGGSDRGPVLLQVSLADSSVLASVPLDPNLQVIGADGDGGVLMTMLGGPTWRVRPGGAVDPLPTVQGTLVAAGRGVVLEQRCDDRLRCGLVAHAVDRDDGVHFDLAASPFVTGAVSPDGRRSALWATGREAGHVELTVLELLTGATRVIASNDYDQLSVVAWASSDALVFKQGGDLRYVRLDQPGTPPAPILVNGEELDLDPFGIGAKS
jgi:hypothetical protein